ncbi:hypothetical protein [Flavobacterium sp. UBA4854]|uniref:hypothetical protein n=1 Tax=Flavobacterium sp. UBA4854 TaxID=1946548 RepID=UPI00258011BB|nr:hypothetical protein [Flavobacterium sp. UBA4854]
MQDADFLLNKLTSMPSSWSVESVASWLEDVNDIDMFEKLESLLDTDLSKNQWRGVLTFLNQKYANSVEPTHDFNNAFEKFSDNIILDKLSSVYLLDDKSKVIDFSKLSNLKKAKAVMAYQCQELTFNNPDLEMLNAVFLPKLNKITNLQSAIDLRYLTIVKCNKLNDFSFLGQLKKLIYLDLSNNKLIENLDFIPEDSQIKVLYLLESNIIKNKETIARLSLMKNLKYLYIKANKLEKKELRECLPNCFVNGEEPVAGQL